MTTGESLARSSRAPQLRVVAAPAARAWGPAAAALATFGVAALVAAAGGGYFPTAWDWSALVLPWLAGVALLVRREVAVTRSCAETQKKKVVVGAVNAGSDQCRPGYGFGTRTTSTLGRPDSTATEATLLRCSAHARRRTARPRWSRRASRSTSRRISRSACSRRAVRSCS